MTDDAEDGFLEITLVSIDEVDDQPASAAGAYAGQVLDSRYEIIERMGRGGAGEVYRAKVLAGGPDVAIKVMRPRVARNPDNVRRFRREARAAAMLDHPNVIRVVELARDQNGTMFIVMERLLGESVATWLAGLGRLPTIDEVTSVFRPMLDAFEAAHGREIVHRDLKTENLFLARGDDGQTTLKVLDFGLAHVADPDDAGTLTKPDAIGGTIEYMSPEQCRSLRVGPSTDLYAMGCLLTELLQGRPPFDGGAAAEIMARQMFMKPPSLDRPEGAEPVPDALEALRLSLLEKEPDQRPASVTEVKRRYVRAMAKAPPSIAPPPSTPTPASERPSHETLSDRVKRLFGLAK